LDVRKKQIGSIDAERSEEMQSTIRSACRTRSHRTAFIVAQTFTFTFGVLCIAYWGTESCDQPFEAWIIATLLLYIAFSIDVVSGLFVERRNYYRRPANFVSHHGLGKNTPIWTVAWLICAALGTLFLARAGHYQLSTSQCQLLWERWIVNASRVTTGQSNLCWPCHYGPNLINDHRQDALPALNGVTISLVVFCWIFVIMVINHWIDSMLDDDPNNRPRRQRHNRRQPSTQQSASSDDSEVSVSEDAERSEEGIP
jgi:hypothetical protein